MYDAIEIVLPGETYRLTTAIRDVILEGKDYLRADVRLEMSNHEAVISLADEHRLSKRAASAGGVRPTQADINIVRVGDDGEVVLRWRGRLVSLSFADACVVFHVESAFVLAMTTHVPLIVGRTCPHTLFDARCRLDRAAFLQRATIMAIEHTSVMLDVNLTPNWASGGVFTHVASGERTDIIAQSDISGRSGSRIVLHSGCYNARVGDLVEVTPGCDREISTCHSKFNNRQNFGGLPHLPTRNPFQAD